MVDRLMTEGVDTVIARVRQTYGRWRRSTSVAERRADWDRLFGVAQVDAEVRPAVLADRPADWVVAPGSDGGPAMLYLHGGGFQIGSPHSHRELMAGLSSATGCRVVGLDYRLAPEHPWPAPLQDALAAWDALLAQGETPARLVVAGDSAGGGLVLLLALALRDARRPLPAALVTLSAWTDLGACGDSYRTRAEADPINQRPMIQMMAQGTLGPEMDRASPSVSPLFADLTGLPSLLMQVGDREIVLSDSQDFVAKARAAGVDASLQVWPDMIHVFQQFPAELRAAREARQAIGAFVRARLDRS